MELIKIQPWDLNENIGKKMVVYSFIFPEGHIGILVGYNRGLGPITFDLEDYVHIPDDSGRRFRRKPATHSD